MFELRIQGFKTEEAVRKFASWYEGQGEQYLSEVWDDMKGEEDVGESPLVIMDPPYIKKDGNILTIKVEN